MREIGFEQLNIRYAPDGSTEVILTAPKSMRRACEYVYSDFSASGGKWVAKIGKHRVKRSIDANAYMWVLCNKVAEKIGSTKEEVYRMAVRAVGVFVPVLVQGKAVESTIAHWNASGLGAFAQVSHESPKNPGCTVLHLYYGSSTYNTSEMSRLIDYIVQEAQNLGIETMTPDELERIKAAWGTGGNDGRTKDRN